MLDEGNFSPAANSCDSTYGFVAGPIFAVLRDTLLNRALGYLRILAPTDFDSPERSGTAKSPRRYSVFCLWLAFAERSLESFPYGALPRALHLRDIYPSARAPAYLHIVQHD
jgi:hypothetical protein